MKLKYCTFTGVDLDTSLDALEFLSNKYNFIEWGVLLSFSASEDKQDKRYPPLTHILEINRFLSKKPHLNFALHLCGPAVYGFINENVDLSAYIEHFGRIQLNINANRVDAVQLASIMKSHPTKEFITQHNRSNENLAEFLRDVPNHSILFDASGGRGVSPGSWPAPLSFKHCGYAGGLGPDNIGEELVGIERVAKDTPISIDMESRIRDKNDDFDLSLCQSVASEVQAFLNPANRPYFKS